MEEYLRQLPFWEKLSGEHRELCLRRAREETFGAGEMVYVPTQGCLGMIQVLEGVLQVSLTVEDGRRATMSRLRGGELCMLTMSCMLTDITFDVEIRAEEPSRLLIIPADTFSRLAEENLYVENFSYRVITGRFSSVMQAVRQMLFCSLEERVVSFLLDESAATGSDTVRVTQEKLAQDIGSAREAVGRVLKRLGSRGLIQIGRGAVRLRDQGALYQMVSE